MPLYEYQCTKCGNRFEVRQSIGADGSYLRCPVCDAEKPRKLISMFSPRNVGGHSGADIGCAFPSSGGA